MRTFVYYHASCCGGNFSSERNVSSRDLGGILILFYGNLVINLKCRHTGAYESEGRLKCSSVL